MSNVITRPIGTRFNYNGVELEVVENTLAPDNFCGGESDPCYFWNECAKRNYDIVKCRGCCGDFTRTDGKDVYFKEVKS